MLAANASTGVAAPGALRQAAIGAQVLSGDPARRIDRQEAHHLRDVFGIADPPEGRQARKNNAPAHGPRNDWFST